MPIQQSLELMDIIYVNFYAMSPLDIKNAPLAKILRTPLHHCMCVGRARRGPGASGHTARGGKIRTLPPDAPQPWKARRGKICPPPVTLGSRKCLEISKTHNFSSFCPSLLARIMGTPLEGT